MSSHSLWSQWSALLLNGLAGLAAVAGLVGAGGTWAVMAFYPDDRPNTWLQNAGPFLAYVLPSWACAVALVIAARRVGRGSRRRS